MIRGQNETLHCAALSTLSAARGPAWQASTSQGPLTWSDDVNHDPSEVAKYGEDIRDLPTPEVGVPLLDEGCRTLYEILGSEEDRLSLLLERKCLLECHG